MHKRKLDTRFEGEGSDKQFKSEFGKGHTLDSDEEDEKEVEERNNVLNENDIEGEEDGISRIDDDDVKFTPFNMKEELEEGHFDTEGHYHFNKEKEIKDNWLDNIDWVKIKKDSNYKEKYNTGDGVLSSDESTDEEEAQAAAKFNLVSSYRAILEMMQPRESVKKAMQRIGGKKKISSAERWKMKKAGIVDEGAEKVTRLTELCNEILTRTGNMNIYEETYEMIENKVRAEEKGKATKMAVDAELDMYADDFEEKEKRLAGDDDKDAPGTSGEAKEERKAGEDTVVMWEYKLKAEDETINGPFTSEQMQKMVDDGKFKDTVLVRKVGTESQFYSSARIDFDLYI